MKKDPERRFAFSRGILLCPLCRHWAAVLAGGGRKGGKGRGRKGARARVVLPDCVRDAAAWISRADRESVLGQTLTRSRAGRGGRRIHRRHPKKKKKTPTQPRSLSRRARSPVVIERQAQAGLTVAAHRPIGERRRGGEGERGKKRKRKRGPAPRL